MLLFLTDAGSYPPSVSNSLKASKLAINELVVQIQEFNQRYFHHVVLNICWLFFSWLWYWFNMCRLSKLGIEVQSVLARCGQGSSQLSGSTQLSSKETFISKSEAKTISEINNICEINLFMFWLFIQSLTTYCKMWCICYFPQEFVCVIVGTITRIVMDNHSWCYAACI